MIDVERSGDVARVLLNRPEVGNALNGEAVERLIAILRGLAGEEGVRVVVLTGAGTVFCAGADLQWMKRMRGASSEENARDAAQTAELFFTMHTLDKPVVARVNGPARGGGVGLVAAADLAVAVESATFAFSEVRLGIVPAVIAPYVVKKVGAGRCVSLFLTARPFGSRQAREWGLVDRVAADGELDATVDEVVRSLREAGPVALGQAKKLVGRVDDMTVEEAKSYTAELIARLRQGEEAREGVAAFLEKRKPRWIP